MRRLFAATPNNLKQSIEKDITKQPSNTKTASGARRVVIVGGVAGGASCAARLRRLDEDAEIVMVERGPYISFANCGLPYHIGGVIEERDKLLVQTPDSFNSRFEVDVRTLTEVVDVDAASKTITLRDVDTDERSELAYDALVLSPGAAPFVPPIPGVDLPEVHVLRTIPDMDRIIAACRDNPPEHVTVVGAGFIGLEVAENLVHRGVEVTVVEMGAQVMPNLDYEIAASVGDALTRHGVDLRTSIIKAFDTVAACTGVSESLADRLDLPHRVAWISAKSHASYYPGAESIILKGVFDPDTGRLLGAQAFGRNGVDKRIDVLATAVAAGMTVDQLEALDLAYAPPFSSAKDPVNHLGAVADGIMRGDHPAVSWRELDEDESAAQSALLDVRSPGEFVAGSLPGAVNIPLDDLRDRLDELDADRPLVVFCKEGLRGYLATRVLVQHGFDARNLLGGYHLWRLASS